METKPHKLTVHLPAALIERMKHYQDAVGAKYVEQVKRALDEWLKGKGH